IAILSQRYIKFKSFNTGIRSFLAIIPVIPGSSETRAGNSRFNCFIGGKYTYSHGSCFENAVFYYNIFKFFQAPGEIIYKFLHQSFPSFGKVMRNTSHPEPRWMHTGSGDGRYYIKYPFPVIESIENRRHLTHILSKCTQPNKMTGNPKQFAHHYSNNTGPVRNFNTGKFFNRKKICQVIHYTSQVINTVSIWDKSMPRLPFTHLFSSTVMKSYIRYNVYNIFTI